MRINPEKTSAYNSVTPTAIVYDIQVTSASIAEKVAAAIAEAVGEKPEDVILYAYDGETRTAKYRKVG